MGLSSLWKKIKESPSFKPSHFQIPLSNVDKPEKVGVSIENDKNYFLIRMNEMFLTYKRRWVKDFEPMVFCSVDFNYGGEKVSQPFLLSPNSLQSPFKKFPEGMLFKDIKMAGLHPFKGGTFGITLVLGKMEMNNYLKKLLKFLESTTAAFPGGFSTVIGSYIKLSNMVLDSLEELFDNNDIEPIIGYRREFITDVQDDFHSGYFVLMNADSGEYNPNKFFVKDKSLHYGDSLLTSKPFLSDDFLLYSIEETKKRGDIETLPIGTQFRDLKLEVSKIPGTITEKDRESLSRFLYALNDQVLLSPDLILEQKVNILTEFRKEIQDMINNRQALSGTKNLQIIERNELDKLRFESDFDLLK